MIPDFDKSKLQRQPFTYGVVPSALRNEDSLALLEWLEADAPWQLRVASFYEQFEFSILDAELPGHLQSLFCSESLAALKNCIENVFDADLDDRIDITVHKLVRGQRIRIHNDYIPGRETHRLLIQLNRGWQDSNGGALIFFNSQRADDIHRIFRPLHNTGVLFEISQNSLHAVSPIMDGERYTLVLSFYKNGHAECENPPSTSSAA
ncbi:cyclophane-containing peptide 2OG-Fe(II) oxygenase YhhC [Roseateles oligotrophus]|uniref:2OG-Fe(II) oxygenase n=1 Tax=Roseateles oligotrophus TaxID=1769250 RepID=A0ABT2YMR0_9BURK|nr:cyclophane-containing peptide 2OG-Fe(II) oxygenase YhhC [Roseateles oligotrophus]MCV2371358.1 2OG-Fe(II) oxygenase [Roseateles oligotrophus]